MMEYEERIQKQYGLPFHLRIGLNSGPVVVGKIGDDLRMDYSTIGDTPTLALPHQWAEDYCKPLDSPPWMGGEGGRGG
jgi:hypothetical protein